MKAGDEELARPEEQMSMQKGQQSQETVSLVLRMLGTKVTYV